MVVFARRHVQNQNHGLFLPAGNLDALVVHQIGGAKQVGKAAFLHGIIQHRVKLLGGLGVHGDGVGIHRLALGDEDHLVGEQRLHGSLQILQNAAGDGHGLGLRQSGEQAVGNGGEGLLLYTGQQNVLHGLIGVFLELDLVSGGKPGACGADDPAHVLGDGLLLHRLISDHAHAHGVDLLDGEGRSLGTVLLVGDDGEQRHPEGGLQGIKIFPQGGEGLPEQLRVGGLGNALRALGAFVAIPLTASGQQAGQTKQGHCHQKRQQLVLYSVFHFIFLLFLRPFFLFSCGWLPPVPNSRRRTTDPLRLLRCQ